MTVFGWTSLTDRTEDSGEVLRSLKATCHCNIDYAALGASQHLFSLLDTDIQHELMWCEPCRLSEHVRQMGGA
jgi:hypothetical protein